MINLIPTDQKTSILYARRNSQLVSWLIGLGIAAVGIIVIIVGGLFYLRQDTSNLQTSIKETRALLKEQKEEDVLRRAEEMSGNLKLAVDVLSNEILFSKLLHQIGLVMPPGTVLQNLSLTNDIAATGIDLQISADSYESGSRAHVNLNDKDNGIFEKADLIDITCDTGDDAGDYPCLVQIRALFVNDHNPFLLINDGENN